ncbi:cytochrome P450 [Streptomyces sp. ACA25]|uniref:cytochrome P450 n=1 Tax=Streptomyces sp. ACA25 TaxID=3022596 RepID=UPI0023071800|nr:cytochrome P450 [Streptomyces sp. ACA25]MDB1087839.1 cytochrome P450 [Streptomyces sp. ACA25]
MTPLPPDSFRANGATVPPPGCPARAGSTGPRAALYGPEATTDPMGLYERLRNEHGAIAPVLLEGDVPAWLVLGYDEILHVARSPRRFTRDSRYWRDWQEGLVPADAPVVPMLGWRPNCLSQDGTEHHRLRGAVNDSLERFDRRGLRRSVNRYAGQLIDRFARDGRAELISQYAEQLPMLVLIRLFGLPEEEGPQLVGASRQLVRGSRKAVTSAQYIQDALRRLVAERKARPGRDLATWLLQHHSQLTDEEVEQHLRLVLIAANETTTNLIVNTLRVVLTDPRFRGTLNGGQITLAGAVDQVLWDEPPLMVCPARFATYDMEIDGHTVRRGDLLLLGLAAGNVDPAVRPGPGADMQGNRSHLSFSSGPHECPGADIGRALTGSGIEALLKHLPDLRLTLDEEDLSWTSSTWARHLDALPVEFTPRRVGARPPAAPFPRLRSDGPAALPAGRAAPEDPLGPARGRPAAGRQPGGG